MKPIFYIIIFLLFTSPAFAHGYPTIEEFQTFPGTITQAVIANPAGAIVAVPFAIVGAWAGLATTPFYFNNGVRENVVAGMILIGMAGYMVGQQIGWPFYGIEKLVSLAF